MSDDTGLIQVDENEALTQLLETAECAEDIDLRTRAEAGIPTTDDFIAVIESRSFIGECIRRSMVPAFSLQIQTFANALELQRKCRKALRLIFLSEKADAPEKGANVFEVLSQMAPGISVVVLANNGDPVSAEAAFSHGAKGYIPMTLGLDIAIEAVRFVLAGGTYVPI